MLNTVLRPGVQYSFHAAPFSIPDIKKLDKKLISLTKKVYGLPQSTPNIAVQLPYEMFGMQATSFLTSYARTLGDQLTQALNDKGQLGKIYKGLVQNIIAKNGGATTLLRMTKQACHRSPTLRTLYILKEHKLQLGCTLDKFPTRLSELKQKWTTSENYDSLQINQQESMQKLLNKLLTYDIFELKQITNVNTIMNIAQFREKYKSTPKLIKKRSTNSQAPILHLSTYMPTRMSKHMP
jgi:hypothetical protein